jgi:hypothetical protein
METLQRVLAKYPFAQDLEERHLALPGVLPMSGSKLVR